MTASSFSISHLAIPAVCILIAFLAYTSQYLFLHLEPGPLSDYEFWKFNGLVACIWICYYRACTVDPGRIPRDWKPSRGQGVDVASEEGKIDALVRQRWCRKCEAYKPPRAHHCKVCQRCIPKMDHHCPWTRNCVSHFTFPHFVRFLFYAVVSMVYLESFLFTRASVIWENRRLPSYLGPSIAQLTHLFLLIVVNSLTLFALFILLVRTLWALGANVTTIESWEIERHKTLLRRARHFGGYLDGPDGIKVRIRKQEFPYDIGIWKNIKAGMGGSSNILSWLWPFAATPDRSTGLSFEVNDFEDPGLSWPPPDPDRIPRKPRPMGEPFPVQHFDSAQEEIEAFNRRQREDMERRRGGLGLQRRRKFHERYAHVANAEHDAADGEDSVASDEGEEAWRNADGERLQDFGVDEEVEFYDEDDIPLAELMRRRREQQQQQQS
ncbi:hypothetical protein VTN77DRAFT_5087 [Rasamsonia byssochlamydoides]|uniref:uncharacterized protein n=1 Tax=Rasamsonia byssochlamydoides TaxID=89139 RepID=UPI003743F4D5